MEHFNQREDKIQQLYEASKPQGTTFKCKKPGPGNVTSYFKDLAAIDRDMTAEQIAQCTIEVTYGSNVVGTVDAKKLAKVV